MSYERPLEYELSHSDPEAFKVASIQALGRYSTLGSAVWNYTVERGVVDPKMLTIDSSTWMSRSNAKGNITLGSYPMNHLTKQALFFHAERFIYPKEVTYRLLHESMHSFLYLIQNTQAGENLLRATTNVREATGGEKGLSALGSLSFYKDENKAVEDATELMTMYAWNPNYAEEFTDFLANPHLAEVRNEVGLVDMVESHTLLNIITRAVEDNV